MKVRSSVKAFVLIVVCVPVGVSQSQIKPIKHTYYLESWTGQPGKPDKTDHAPVGEGNLITCIDVQPTDGTVLGCHIKLENGEHYDLTFRQAISSAKTDVAYLTCNTDPPTGVPTSYCKVSIAVLPAK